MQIMRLVCFLFILCSVFEFNKRFLGYFLDLFFMDCVEGLKHLSLNADFGFGFLVFGWFGQVYKVLGLFLLFGLGLRVLQFSWYCKGWNRFLCDFCGKSGELRNGCCSNNDFNEKCSAKMRFCKNGLLEEEKVKCVSDGELNDDEQECCDEDKVFDVLSLRKMVKIERQRANAACLELEKERMAAATAAEETMAMILRLQNEKSLVEMEANQYKRLAEEKQLHDQEVIQSLQWLVLKHESERSILEDQLKLCCRKKLNSFGKRDDEGDHSEVVDEENHSSLNTNLDDAFHYTLFSSLDMDLSPE
ncbi:myosin-binding protein 3 [Nicotiana attenuata]|uniref:Myosin-binding protein 3 n=1 Tax=Nicotiana attenuata TaxID=49451 RepID=A0A314KJH6_NICAT|nr:myosin-binding protein 3 [Nicotiana attenuata]